MNAARFDLAEVDEELREQVIGTTHETACAFEQLGVGELRERRLAKSAGCIDGYVRLHRPTLNPRFRRSPKARSRVLEH